LVDVAASPNVASSIRHRFERGDLPWRGVIHHGTGNGASLNDIRTIRESGGPMLSAHITSFLKLISAQLEETSRGVTNSHHVHNVQCGIQNILSLLEYNNDVIESADRLLRRASSYIAHHEPSSRKMGDVSEDADRLRAAQDALAGFRSVVERSRPNARVRTLGL
jgi:hypothetical protein